MSLLYLSLLPFLLLPAILANAGRDDTLSIVANGHVSDDDLKDAEDI